MNATRDLDSGRAMLTPEGKKLYDRRVSAFEGCLGPLGPYARFAIAESVRLTAAELAAQLRGDAAAAAESADLLRTLLDGLPGLAEDERAGRLPTKPITCQEVH